jgi:hypothetical protein
MHIQKILQLSEVRLVAAVAYYEGPARIIRGVNGRSSGLWPQESGTRYNGGIELRNTSFRLRP